MYPMSYISLEKEDRSIGLVWADSSKRILSVIEAPITWIGTDITLAITRLRSAGWEEVSRGKVKVEQ